MKDRIFMNKYKKTSIKIRTMMSLLILLLLLLNFQTGCGKSSPSGDSSSEVSSGYDSSKPDSSKAEIDSKDSLGSQSDLSSSENQDKSLIDSSVDIGSGSLPSQTSKTDKGSKSETSHGTSSKPDANDYSTHTRSGIFVNVKDFGAKGNGKDNDAGAIQKAINSIEATGGTVYLPDGNYRLTKGIKVPIGVQILGETPTTRAKWRKISANSKASSAEAGGSSFLSAENFSGSWILVEHGKGKVNSDPTFELKGNSTIENIGFVYPDQAPVTGNVNKYPPAVAIITSGTDYYVRDGMRIAGLNLLNPYVGIAIMQYRDLDNYFLGQNEGLYSTGRITVSDITGSPLYKGILVKGMLDTIDIQRVHFGYSNFQETFANFRHNNAIDFEIARADGNNMYDCSSLGALYGLKSTAAFTGRASSIRASKLTIRSTKPLSFVTGMYLISDSKIYMENYGGFAQVNTYTGIEVLQDMNSVHQPFYLFSNLKIENTIKSSSISNTAMHIKLGRSGNASINNCIFENADPSGNYPVINYEQNDGSNTSVFINGSTFNHSGNKGLLAKTQNIVGGSLQFQDCLIADSLYTQMPISPSIWFLNSKLKSGTVLHNK